MAGTRGPRPSTSRANEPNKGGPKGVDKKARPVRNTQQKAKELDGLFDEKGKLPQSVNEAEEKIKSAPDAEKERWEGAYKAEMNRLRQVDDKLSQAQESAEHVEENIDMDIDSETPGQPTDIEGMPGRAADATIVKDGIDGSTPPDLANARAGDGNLEIVDLTEDNESKSDLLGNGKSLIRENARNRSIYLNSYSPRNSPMLTWEPLEASKTVESMTRIRALPHRAALEQDKENGSYSHHGKIASIKAIAWKPKSKIQYMNDLLDSVAELDPARKASGRYIFPYSTMLVSWRHNMSPVWISRSGYKTLTGTGKKAQERTDRKFNQIAYLQVQRYRDFTGDKRLREDRSPTPLGETPAPEDSRLRPKGTRRPRLDAQSQNAQGQNARGQNAQSQNAHGQNAQDENAQDQDAQGQNAHDQDRSGKRGSRSSQ